MNTGTFSPSFLTTQLPNRSGSVLRSSAEPNLVRGTLPLAHLEKFSTLTPPGLAFTRLNHETNPLQTLNTHFVSMTSRATEKRQLHIPPSGSYMFYSSDPKYGLSFRPLSASQVVSILAPLRHAPALQQHNANTFAITQVEQAVLRLLDTRSVTSRSPTHTAAYLSETLNAHGVHLRLLGPTQDPQADAFRPSFGILVSPFDWLRDLLDWVSRQVKRFIENKPEPIPPFDDPIPPLPPGGEDLTEPPSTIYVKLFEVWIFDALLNVTPPDPLGGRGWSAGLSIGIGF